MAAGSSIGLPVTLPRWLPGAAIAMLGALVIVASGFLIQSLMEGDDSGEPVAAQSVIAPGRDAAMARHRRRTPRCDECGVVESIRTVTLTDGMSAGMTGAVTGSAATRGATAGGRMTQPVGATNAVGATNGPRRAVEIVIRLQDGSTQIITDADSARWRQGERVKLIAGSVP